MQDSSYLAQIFVLYECSPDFSNTMEQLTKCLSAGMERTSGSLEVAELSSEVLCNFISTIEASLSRAFKHPKSQQQWSASKLLELLELRRIKSIFKEAARLFNQYPKDAFAMLKDHKLLSPVPTPEEVANFLRKAQGFDKRALGEYLVKPDNIEILRGFFSAFKFNQDTSIDSALRQVLESFRLPGEAQQIDRIMGCFAEVYYPAAKDTFASQDACYVLAYSTLMLNTDLHNPQVKYKMTQAEFIRNNRGINDGEDVDEECLIRLYHSIKTREIVMPEEHGGEEAFASQWNEALRRAVLLDAQMPLDNRHFDSYSLTPLVKGVIEIVWKPIVVSLIPYVNQQRPSGEAIADGPLNAFKGIASLFAQFGMVDALEAMLGNIFSVSSIITVFSAASGNMLPRYLAKLQSFQQVVALIVDIFWQQGNGLRQGWSHLARILIMFAESDLLSWEDVVLGDQVNCGGQSIIRLIKLAHEGRHVRDVAKPSLFARFFGGNSSNGPSAGNPTYPSSSSPVSEDETKVAARKFVQGLPIESILVETSKKLDDSAFHSFLNALAAYIQWKLGVPNGGDMEGENKTGRRPINMPGSNWSEGTIILLIEALISVGLSCQDLTRLKEKIWPTSFAVLTRLTTPEPAQAPLMICEHVAVGLARLALWIVTVEGSDSPDSDGCVIFNEYAKFLCQLGPNLISHVLEPVLLIMTEALRNNDNLMTGAGTLYDGGIWAPFFTLLSVSMKHESTLVFSVELMSLAAPGRFPVDFTSEFIELLGQMATISKNSPKTIPSVDGVSECKRIDIALQAIELHAVIHTARSAQMTNLESWSRYVCPIEASLARLVTHVQREIRQAALAQLSHLLPQLPEAVTPLSAIPTIFASVLMPLLQDLRLRSVPMDESVMRAVSLATKTFLWFVQDNQENSNGGTSQLWKDLLTVLLALLHDASEQLRESIHEAIKNVLLVLATTEDAQTAEAEVWRVSAVLLDSSILNWREEIQMRLKVASPQNESDGQASLKDKEEEEEEKVAEQLHQCNNGSNSTSTNISEIQV